MLTFPIKNIYTTDEVENDPLSLARANRMIASMKPREIVRGVTMERLNDLVVERGWDKYFYWGEAEDDIEQDVVFTKSNSINSEEQEQRELNPSWGPVPDGMAELSSKYPNLNYRWLNGFRSLALRNNGFAEFRKERGVVCQSAWHIHSILGCPIRCQYCDFGGVINIRANVEELVEYVDSRIGELKPRQNIWKWDNHTDINCFEPEFGGTRLMVEYFAQRKKDWLLLYVGKSANVDFMLDFEHNGHTIMMWSMGPRSQSQNIEINSDPWDERIEAARKCEEAGYPVRYRFSPIIPVKNWRQEYSECITRMLTETTPEVITLTMLGWTDWENAKTRMDTSAWDPDMVAAAEGAASFMNGKDHSPLPHEARAELYRHIIGEIKRVNNKVRISLCLETPEMWRLFSDDIHQTEDDFVCNCGPNSFPGHPKFTVDETEETSCAPTDYLMSRYKVGEYLQEGEFDKKNLRDT